MREGQRLLCGAQKGWAVSTRLASLVLLRGEAEGQVPAGLPAAVPSFLPSSLGCAVVGRSLAQLLPRTYFAFYFKLLRPLLSLQSVLRHLWLLTLNDVLAAPFLCDGARKLFPNTFFWV